MQRGGPIGDESHGDYDPYSTALLRRRPNGTWVVPEVELFEPPNVMDTPQSLFPTTAIRHRSIPGTMTNLRFVNQHNPHEMLIYTDGACPNNGQRYPKAGWGFVIHGPTSRYPAYTVIGRLEQYGPSGKLGPQASNRAELRAVLAALEARAWYVEDWYSVVIATDSEYVAHGATAWIRSWASNDWRTSNGDVAKNLDLWQALMRVILDYQNRGTSISFWPIRRERNMQADAAAKEGAQGPDLVGFEKAMLMG
ncbi:RNase H domain protein [Phlyctema vagabunda]|uniref:ribonuclease H n=1 Tax=Phlyctema vagabunda TaxID=108571 RepID=A0ABR4P8S6_9HELO